MPDAPSWPDTVLAESPILGVDEILRRLTARIRRLETFLAEPGLDRERYLSIETRLDFLYAEFRAWYEDSEDARAQRLTERRVAGLAEDQERLWSVLEQLL